MMDDLGRAVECGPMSVSSVRSLVERLGQPICVEVGSWLGHTALAMLDAGAAKVYCVDTWKGSPDPLDLAHNVPADMYERFWAKVLHKPGIIPCRGESLEWAEAFTKEPQLDLVFIDGDHRYASVVADLKAWGALIRPGGILCGHDYDWPDVRRAVDESGPCQLLPGEIWWRRV